jgi:hypothetical protein
MLLKNQHMLPAVVLLLGILLSACYRTTDAELIRELNASAGTPIASLNTQINVNGLRDGDCFNSPQVLDDMTVEWETIQLVPCNGGGVTASLGHSKSAQMESILESGTLLVRQRATVIIDTTSSYTHCQRLGHWGIELSNA